MAGVFYQYVGLEPLDIEPYKEEPNECVLSLTEWKSFLGESKVKNFLDNGMLVHVVPCRMDQNSGNFVEVKSVASCETMKEVQSLSERDEFGWLMI